MQEENESLRHFLLPVFPQLLASGIQLLKQLDKEIARGGRGSDPQKLNERVPEHDRVDDLVLRVYRLTDHNTAASTSRKHIARWRRVTDARGQELKEGVRVLSRMHQGREEIDRSGFEMRLALVAECKEKEETKAHFKEELNDIVYQIRKEEMQYLLPESYPK
jgi:hypothetical protein